MKKLFIILAFIMPLAVTAQKAKYDKLIKKYDVLQYLPDSCDRSPVTFWKAVVNNNPLLNKNLEKFLNPKGSAREALDKVNSIRLRAISEDSQLPKLDYKDFNENIHREILGNVSGTEQMSFSVLNNEEWNAFCSPEGHVYINVGLIKRLDSNNEMVVGVLVHEIAHYLLRHMLMHEYECIKKEKKNNLAAAIGVVGIGAANMVAASNGYYDEGQEQYYHEIVEGAKEWTRNFYYRYSREQEIESDICAYRFLEWVGDDPNLYIQALEKINLDLFTSDDKDSDHPTIEFRTELLKKLQPASLGLMSEQEGKKE